MKIYLGPQINDNERMFYKFDGEKVTVSAGNITDTFDFTGLPDGVLEMQNKETGEELIKTNLPINPITSAKKVDGVLYLELLNWIPSDAPEEMMFPEWIDPINYVKPKEVVKGEDGGTVEEPRTNEPGTGETETGKKASGNAE